MVLIALALACSSSPPTASPAVSGALSGGWIEALVRSPERFAQVVEGHRDGWIAMHASDWTAAAAGLPAGLPAARAELELALVDEDLARLAAVAWPLLLTRWRQSDPTIDDSTLPLLSALAVADIGDSPSSDEFGTGTDAQAWVSALQNPGPDTLAAVSKPADPRLARCLHAHVVIRQDATAALPSQCLQAVPFGGGAGPALHDPLLPGSLALQHRQRAASLAGGDLADALQGGDMGALLFSAWWSRADLDAELANDPDLANPGATGPTLSALALPDEGPDDAPQAARERVRALDAALDAWVEGLRSSASPDGGALLDDLQLVAGVRSQVLVAWARAALLTDRPHQATAYLQLALDLESAGEPGPTNPPALFVLQAEALLRTGRTRQALDALSALAERLPELAGTVETIGDLAVLEGMGRHGDSKEN